MGLNPANIPMKMRKLMTSDARKEMSMPSQDECDSKFEAGLEKVLQQQVADLLRRNGIWFEWKAMHKKSTGTLGCPDFLFAYNGQAVAFECKTATGVLSEDQKEAHRAMRLDDWMVIVIRDYEQAVNGLNSLAILKGDRPGVEVGIREEK